MICLKSEKVTILKHFFCSTSTRKSKPKCYNHVQDKNKIRHNKLENGNKLGHNNEVWKEYHLLYLASYLVVECENSMIDICQFIYLNILYILNRN